MKPLLKKDIGSLGEKLAAKHLRRQRCKILARNCQCGKNELDLVVKDGDYIAFVEVKTLTFEHAKENTDRRPSMAIDIGKRRRTAEAMRHYLREHPTKLLPRLDAVEVYLDRETLKPFKIHHIPDAFGTDGSIH
ncbi:MAG: YraN family protein [Ruminococcaceae bacterium]|nr:YraN family protein [Oscillospiraceae bacterium]